MPKKLLTACTVILMVASFSRIIEVVNAQQNKYYAGYALYGFETYAEAGVLGEIFTIDPTVSGMNFAAEWVTIILRYYPTRLWLQTGYYKGFRTELKLRYYWEWNDIYSGHYIEFGGEPSPGTWHTYYITHPCEYEESPFEEEWRFYIDGTQTCVAWVFPSWARDQQAFVETTSPTINIDGSHFTRLSYLTLDHYWFWRRWPTHQPYWDPPYTLIEESHYEFYAYGGG